jgi:exopolysaccharide biosynthesis polyprenyl glycosylphosphotransferase
VDTNLNPVNSPIVQHDDAVEQAATKRQDVFGDELILFDRLPGRLSKRARAASDETVLRRAMAAADLFSVAAAIAVAGSIVGANSIGNLSFLALLFVVPMMKIMGLYDRDANLLHKTTLEDTPQLVAAAMALTLVAVTLPGLIGSEPVLIDTMTLPVMVAAMTVLLVISRRLTRSAVTAIAPEERLLMISGAEDADRLDDRLKRSATVKASVIARIPIGFTELPHGPARVLNNRQQLENIVRDQQISRIVIMPGERHSDEVADVIRTVRSIDVKLNVLPNAGDAIGASTLIDDVAGLQMVAVRDHTMSASSRMVKRGLDVVGAGLGLILISPLLCAIAIAIKLDSRGAVFFKQRRIGRDGKPFEMIKFRSMVKDADAVKHELAHLSVTEDFFKIENDPRITRVGSFIRKTSIDELPQLINVLRGDMSLVGPRPLVPEEDGAISGWYRRRSQITPGITGVWQLLGNVRIPLEEMAKLDYMYVANWSLWSDIKILVRTVGHVLGRRGL